MRFGQGERQYELVEGWGPLPDGWTFSEIAAIAVDSRDRVYAYHRGMHPVVVFDREGTVVAGWGDGMLAQAHGMYIASDDSLFLVDRGSHVIEKCTTEGKRVLTIGDKYQAAPKFSNQPFNLPQGVAVAPTGDIYVADGKCNNAIHRFKADGAYVQSWGNEGTGPGQFKEPHGIWVKADGTVIVADRGNDRLQFFSPDGEYLSEWGTDVIHHPDHIYLDAEGVIYVTEIDYHRISILTPDGELISRWGGGPGVQVGRLQGSKEPGRFDSPHGVWCDSRGDLYISEVRRGRRIQKFARI
jgi:DNA-binding beta-propeller fold protein YncE